MFYWDLELFAFTIDNYFKAFHKKFKWIIGTVINVLENCVYC